MKLTKIILLAAAGLTNSFWAGAQTTTTSANGVPGPTEYTKFSQFIANRDIFDPNRVPHTVYRPGPRPSNTGGRSQRPTSAPMFSLVGTMSYEKGLFAFFDGNNSGLRRVLPVNASYQGYTIAKLAQGKVLLETADKSQQVVLNTGEIMRQQNGKWVKSGSGPVSTGTMSSPGALISAFNSGAADSGTVDSGAADSGTDSSAGGSASRSDSTAAAPSAALSQNEVLKRLMELRKKEEQ